MSEEARKVIEDGAFTLPEVIAEVVYVLKGVYKIDRDEIGRTCKYAITTKSKLRNLFGSKSNRFLFLWIDKMLENI